MKMKYNSNNGVKFKCHLLKFTDWFTNTDLKAASPASTHMANYISAFDRDVLCIENGIQNRLSGQVKSLSPLIKTGFQKVE